jgi:endonuclease YncB( thermonuclease family)
MIEPSYIYKAVLVSVHDGDTVTLDVDLGFHVTVRIAARLYGINAPELSTFEGKTARVHLSDLLGIHPGVPAAVPEPLTIHTFKDPGDKYGRWLAVLFNDSVGDVNQRMVTEGFAVAYDGGKKV